MSGVQNASPPSRRARWQRIWLGVAVLAVVARAVLWLANSAPAARPAVPRWPVHAGDVLTVRPGDPAVIEWAKDPANLGLIVESVERYHAKILGRLKCGLMPEIMADPDGVGGTLTVVSHDGADWLVAWEGEPTMRLEDPDSGRLSSCGRIALVRMGDEQLRALVDLLGSRMTEADTAAMR